MRPHRTYLEGFQEGKRIPGAGRIRHQATQAGGQVGGAVQHALVDAARGDREGTQSCLTAGAASAIQGACIAAQQDHLALPGRASAPAAR